MRRYFREHDVDAELDYAFDWSRWLSSGATIISSQWIVPAGVTILDESLTSPIAVVWVRTDSSLLGTNIKLVNRVISSTGQQDDRTLTLAVTQR